MRANVMSQTTYPPLATGTIPPDLKFVAYGRIQKCRSLTDVGGGGIWVVKYPREYQYRGRGVAWVRQTCKDTALSSFAPKVHTG
eukprot:3928794-Amphidinium_carterae.1